jgi:hypothetical protein
MKFATAFASLVAACMVAGLSSCGLVGPLVHAAMPLAGAKLVFSCIPEHTAVDTPSGPRLVERLEAGDWVTGYAGRPVRVLQKHSYLESPATAFLRVTFSEGASVDLCAMHRVAGIRAGMLRIGNTVAGRKVTAIESRHGIIHSFDLLTEDAGYQVHGIPVNSMIEEMQAAAASGMRAVRE